VVVDLIILWLIFLSYDHETVFGRNGIVSFFGNHSEMVLFHFLENQYEMVLFNKFQLDLEVRNIYYQDFKFFSLSLSYHNLKTESFMFSL
jgi:hypothetical protein